jgi:hypothetical protein
MRRIHAAFVVIALFILGCSGSDPATEGYPGPGSPSGDPPDLPAYSSAYSREKGFADYEGFNLGIGCADDQTLLGESAMEAGSVREYPFERWSMVASPDEVREPSDVLEYLNAANSAYGVSIIPGPGTVAFLDSLSWGDSSISLVFGYVGAGPYKLFRSPPALTPETAALLREGGAEAFRARYGAQYAYLARSGYAAVVIVSYEIDSRCPIPPEEYKRNIRRLYMSWATAEEKAALLPCIEIPGVRKRTHFYSTFADDPSGEVDDTANLAAFVRGHCDESNSMRDDAYALVGYSTRKYEELP